MLPYSRVQIDFARGRWDASFVGDFLFSNTWGRTFRVHEAANGTTHSVYVRAGPYVSFLCRRRHPQRVRGYVDVGNIVRSIDELLFRPDLVGLRLEFGIENHTYTPLAAAITGSYRLRLPLPWSAARAETADYHYIHGLAYENVGLDFAAKFPRLRDTRILARREVRHEDGGVGQGRAAVAG